MKSTFNLGTDYKTELYNCTKNFELGLANECQSNPKKFWNYVSSKDHARRCVKRLTTDDGEATVTQKLANLLNNQFASIFTTEPDGEPPPAPKYIILSPMSTVVITVPMVQKRLKNLNANKSASPDGIHPRLLKETATEISPAFSHLFQFSLGSRVIPSEWKTAYITPIFKRGDRSKLNTIDL